MKLFKQTLADMDAGLPPPADFNGFPPKPIPEETSLVMISPVPALEDAAVPDLAVAVPVDERIENLLLRVDALEKRLAKFEKGSSLPEREQPPAIQVKILNVDGKFLETTEEGVRFSWKIELQSEHHTEQCVVAGIQLVDAQKFVLAEAESPELRLPPSARQRYGGILMLDPRIEEDIAGVRGFARVIT